MDIFNYIRLSKREKEMVLSNEAIFLENYSENGKSVNVYYLHNFFVELVFSNGVLIDNIPYQRGYKVNESQLFFKEQRPVFYKTAA